MKKNKIAYRVFTVLFIAMMLLASIPDIVVTKEAHDYMVMLGFTDEFTRFIGIAKLLGCIAIAVPGHLRIKEWAYAGIFFDLIAAVYFILVMSDEKASVLFLLLPLCLWFGSYYFYHKVSKQKQVQKVVYA